MKNLFILALLAFTAISVDATTTLGYEKQGQQQLFPDPQQQPPFSQQEPFPYTW
jgi:hypothetical protein